MSRTFPDLPRNHFWKYHLSIAESRQYFLFDDFLKRVEDFCHFRPEYPLPPAHAVLNPLALLQFKSRVAPKVTVFLWTFPDQIPVLSLCPVESLLYLLLDEIHYAVRDFFLDLLFADRELQR